MRSFVKSLFRCTNLMCVILVAACSTSSMSVMAQAKQDFISQNYELSYQKVKATADQGDADAQYALAYMMYYGKGTAQDVDGSYVWFHKAAAQGQSQAIKALALLKQAQQHTTQPQVVPTTSPSHAVMPHAPASVHTMTPHAPAAVPATQPSGLVRDIAGVKPAPVVPAAHGSSNLDKAVPVFTPTTGSVTPDHHLAPQHPAGAVPAHPAVPHDSMRSSFRMVPARAVRWVSEQALMQRPSNHYTIQIMGASRKQALQRFAKRHGLQQVSIYSTTLQGMPWHVLLQGDYPSHDTAKMALSGLRVELKTAKPWMRAMATIQAGMRANGHAGG